MLLDSGQRSIVAWYFMFSICFFNASLSMAATTLGSMTARALPHATCAEHVRTGSVNTALLSLTFSLSHTHTHNIWSSDVQCERYLVISYQHCESFLSPCCNLKVMLRSTRILLQIVANVWKKKHIIMIILTLLIGFHVANRN